MSVFRPSASFFKSRMSFWAAATLFSRLQNFPETRNTIQINEKDRHGSHRLFANKFKNILRLFKNFPQVFQELLSEKIQGQQWTSNHVK